MYVNKLKQLPVGKLVFFTFGTLCAILLAIGALFYFSLKSIEHSSRQEQSRALGKLALIDDTAQEAGQMQADVLRQIMASDAEEIKRLDRTVREIEKINASELADFQKFLDDKKEKQLYDSVMQARKTYYEQTQSALASGDVNKDAEATQTINSTQAPAYDEYLKAVNMLIDDVETDANETGRSTARFISGIRIAGDVLIGMTILIAIGAGFAAAAVGQRLNEDNDNLQSEIKERKKAEGELHWKTAFLEALMNSSIDGILVVDQEGKQSSYQNQRFVDLFQFPEEIARENNDETRLRWVKEMTKNPEQFLDRVRHLYAHPHEKSRDEIELKNGTILDRYSSPVIGQDGNYHGRIWTFRDITERKSTEETLHLLGSAVEQSNESIMITDAGLDLPGPKILFVNPYFSKMTGYTAEETLGKTPRILQGPHTDRVVLDRLRKNLDEGEVFAGEAINYHKDGKEFMLEWQIAPIRNASNKITHFVAIQRDITDRKQAEAALKESELRYHSLFENMLEGYAYCRMLCEEGQLPDFIYLEVNKAFEKLTGLSNVVGKKVSEVIPGIRKDNRELFETYARVALTGKPERYETHLEALGIWFSISVYSHKKDYFVAVFDNITERKQAENALRESNEKFRQLADNITDAFWIRSPDMSEVQYISPAFERIWGRTVESLYANPHEWVDFILPEDRGRVEAAFAALTGDSSSLDIEYRIVRLDGEARWVRVRGFQVRNAANRLIRHTGIVTDITDRKRADKAIQESEERFSGAFEHAPIGVALVSPEGRWLKVNRALCVLVGYSEAELYALTFQDITYPADLEIDLENMRRMLAGTIPSYQIEKRYFHKRGHLVTVLLNVSLVRDDKGQPRYFISQIQDITERKRLESHLLQSQKMETVGKLAGGVAHEFNSIMTAIIGQSELLLNDLPAGNPMHESAGEIRKAAERAAALTQQLLAYGRKQILQPETLDLNSVLAGMETTLRHLAGGGTDVRIAPTAGLKAVKADAGQIEQVIMNMAINAADAMPNGGMLTLETANVTLGQEYASRFPDLKAGEYVMLAITDTGTGMSEEIKARLFEPFFTTKGIGQGTGLGLSTCYGIVKQSGGHISVYSEPGRGSTFKIYLPQVEQKARVPIKRLDSSDLPRGTETILLVEDDPALREMAATLLQRLGYTVFAAANGIEALSLKQQRGIGHIDLLFTDVVMPHMSGKELADRMKVLFPHTRILFTSAYAENAIVHQGVLDKGVALLQKPFTPSALAHKLRDVLGGTYIDQV